MQICPVGALTSAKYRFRSRPFDLVSTPTVCEHCASGLRPAHRRPPRRRACAAWPGTSPRSTRSGTATRAASPSRYQADGRLEHPLVRDEDGTLVTASWPEAISLRGGRAARRRVPHGRPHRRAAHARGRLRVREVRPHRPRHRRHRLPGPRRLRRGGRVPRRARRRPAAAVRPTRDLESAPVVVLAGLDAEDESPIVFLRLRKGARTRGRAGVLRRAVRVVRRGQGRRSAARHRPGAARPPILDALADDAADGGLGDAARLLREPGAVLLVGERLAQSRGRALGGGPRSPRPPARGSAGCRGARVSAARSTPVRWPGCCPAVARSPSEAARAEVAEVWGIDAAALPATPGRDLPAVVAALHDDAAATASATDPTTVERAVAALLVGRRRAGRPRRPGRVPRGARGGPVRGLPRAAPLGR